MCGKRINVVLMYTIFVPIPFFRCVSCVAWSPRNDGHQRSLLMLRFSWSETKLHIFQISTASHCCFSWSLCCKYYQRKIFAREISIGPAFAPASSTLFTLYQFFFNKSTDSGVSAVTVPRNRVLDICRLSMECKFSTRSKLG